MCMSKLGPAPLMVFLCKTPMYCKPVFPDKCLSMFLWIYSVIQAVFCNMKVQWYLLVVWYVSDGQEPTTSHPETIENLSLEFVTWSSPSTVSSTQHIDNEGVGSPLLALTQRANDSGAFRKRAASGKENSLQSGSFILSGADGRGGRVTILKPPSLSLVL